MKTPLSMIVVAALVLAPSLLAQQPAAQVAEAVDGPVAAVMDGAPVSELGAEQALNDLFTVPLLQVEAGETSICSTRCFDGTVLSCSKTPCFAEGSCGVYCAGEFLRCNNICY